MGLADLVDEGEMQRTASSKVPEAHGQPRREFHGLTGPAPDGLRFVGDAQARLQDSEQLIEGVLGHPVSQLELSVRVK